MDANDVVAEMRSALNLKITKFIPHTSKRDQGKAVGSFVGQGFLHFASAADARTALGLSGKVMVRGRQISISPTNDRGQGCHYCGGKHKVNYFFSFIPRAQQKNKLGHPCH